MKGRSSALAQKRKGWERETPNVTFRCGRRTGSRGHCVLAAVGRWPLATVCRYQPSHSLQAAFANRCCGCPVAGVGKRLWGVLVCTYARGCEWVSRRALSRGRGWMRGGKG